MSLPLGVPSVPMPIGSAMEPSALPFEQRRALFEERPAPEAFSPEPALSGAPSFSQMWEVPQPALSGAPSYSQMWSPPVSREDNRDPELLRLTTDELKERYQQNADIIRGLQEDMYRPQTHEERLMRLERQFLPLFPGNELRVDAPVLKKIQEAVLESHEIDHQREIEQLRQNSRDEYFTHMDVVRYLHPTSDSLVLGRSMMPLDRNYEAQVRLAHQLEHDKHPAVEQVRYAGHAARPEQHAECVFVKEEGILKRQPVYPVPYRNDFWLNLDGHTRNDLERHRDAVHKMMEDPVAQRVARRDTVGTGEDALPMDWKGQLKRGVPMPMQRPKEDDGFVMPKWMH
jgi:hypothetical protein